MVGAKIYRARRLISLSYKPWLSWTSSRPKRWLKSRLDLGIIRRRCTPFYLIISSPKWKMSTSLLKISHLQITHPDFVRLGRGHLKYMGTIKDAETQISWRLKVTQMCSRFIKWCTCEVLTRNKASGNLPWTNLIRGSPKICMTAYLSSKARLCRPSLMECRSTLVHHKLLRRASKSRRV